jgi:hypothetical protein
LQQRRQGGGGSLKKMAQDVILPFDKKMGLWQRFR